MKIRDSGIFDFNGIRFRIIEMSFRKI